METHSSILAWKIMERVAWQATVHGVARIGHDLVTKPPQPANQFLNSVIQAVNEVEVQI